MEEVGEKGTKINYVVMESYLPEKGLPASQLLIDYLKKRFGQHRYKM